MSIKFLSFDYTNEQGKKTCREYICTSEPSDKLFGIDVSELGVEEQGIFYAKMQQLYDALHADTLALMEEFDIKYKFRYFKPEQMSNIIKD